MKRAIASEGSERAGELEGRSLRSPSNMNHARLTVLACACAALLGCGHTETHAAMLRAPQAPSDHTVELYFADQSAPTRPYYEIALVQAIGFGSDATPEEVAKALTTKAGSIGCDAVVRTFLDVGYTRAHAAGVCVKYLAPGPPGPVSPLPAVPKPPPPRPATTVEPLPSAPNQGD
jgi:hypothetical protein